MFLHWCCTNCFSTGTWFECLICLRAPFIPSNYPSRSNLSPLPVSLHGFWQMRTTSKSTDVLLAVGHRDNVEFQLETSVRKPESDETGTLHSARLVLHHFCLPICSSGWVMGEGRRDGWRGRISEQASAQLAKEPLVRAINLFIEASLSWAKSLEGRLQLLTRTWHVLVSSCSLPTYRDIHCMSLYVVHPCREGIRIDSCMLFSVSMCHQAV